MGPLIGGLLWPRTNYNLNAHVTCGLYIYNRRVRVMSPKSDNTFVHVHDHIADCHASSPQLI